MHDQGVILRAAFGGKYLAHRRAVAGVGGNAVDRFGRQRHQLTLLQQPGRQGDAFFIDR